MQKYIMVYALVLFSFFSGCNTKNEGGNKSVKHIPQVITKTYEKHFGNCEKSSSDTCAKIVINAFEIKNPWNNEIQTVINSKMKSILLAPIEEGKNYKNIDDMMNDFIESYKKIKVEFPGASRQWEIERTAKIKYINQDFISAEYSEYSYLGGAHPNSYLKFENVNLHSADKIELRDILIPGFENELNLITEGIFRQKKKLGKDDNLEEKGYWFTDNKFKLNDNFGIDDKGLYFYFNSYEIAPYVVGPTELFIPYSKISNLIRGDGILNSFIHTKN